ncbi:MAG: trehalose-phosphatase [Dehalococcoidales bacterium]|nr:trehalose-phosphatase [Dehalococcoidales bacterium]
MDKLKEKTVNITMEKGDAVIFDMDGVITETATVHAAAWKELFDEYLKARADRDGRQYRAFEIDPDYYLYIDGKPRYDGVKSFLNSRGISLPYGRKNDGTDRETICGLGNRKNRYFLRHLEREGATAFRHSVDVVKELTSCGIPVAVISASRNAEEVLKSAGVLDLFDVKVDGVDADELKLKGKPDPAIFLEASRRLGIRPDRTVIVEDAIAGIQAGRRANFKLVVGVDRTGQRENLEKNGADVVVSDLSCLKVKVAGRQKPCGRSINSLPSALERKEEIFGRLDEKNPPAVFLDYDGTLTPIVPDPSAAILSAKTRQVIKNLARHYSVAIISGRDLDDVRNMVDIENIAYAGSHGFDIAGPDGSFRNQERGQKYLPALDLAEKELHKVLADIEGVYIERKRFAIAVHYRNVKDADLGELEERLDSVISRIPKLRKTTGIQIFELRPNSDWDKGMALHALLGELYADAGMIIPLYIGDDITDEDAFREIRDSGIGIVVGRANRKTLAHYKLNNTDEVRKFLEGLAALAEKKVPRGAWMLAYDGYDPDKEGLREAMCTLGNGYLATRGASSEAVADIVHYPGTYVAGCYNRLTSEVAGETVENESLVNLPNWLPLSLRFSDGDWFEPEKVELLEYTQELDIRRGILSRQIRFSDRQRNRTRIFQRRFVSMADPHLAALETSIVAENWSGEVYIRSAIDGRITNGCVKRYCQLNSRHLRPLESQSIDRETVYLKVETNQSHVHIAEAARTRLFQDGEQLVLDPRVIEEEGYIAHEFQTGLKKEEQITIEKIVSLYTSRDPAISESGIAVRKHLAYAASFDELLAHHVLSWDNLWKRCRIAIDDGERVSMILHLHIFHLLQTVSPNTIGLDVGVPPRGLHGEAYRGHIFWDELFIFPFLNLRIPDITRSLLTYRYRRLPEARRAARKAGYKGAIYPWQSGSDGREESQTLHLNPRSGRWIGDNSHLQRHINIAIAYNIWLYYQVTGDIDFLTYYGVEMLIEISRFWASIASFNRSLGRYEIRKVMGPDEYHDSYPGSREPGIDNNAYTNIMAVWVLCRTLETMDLIPPDRREALQEKLALSREEIDHWEDISRRMRIIFHGSGIISQFEGYDKLKEFDWEGYRKRYGNIQRLDRILEAEGDSPNRYRLSKQADVLMVFYLLSSDELRELFGRLNYPFEYETIPKNIEYYLQRTANGSTLSHVVHAWVLARSRRDLSWHLFKEALESDVSDIQGGTTPEGIHLGAMAGTIDLVQRCYTGIETRQDRLQLNPVLPNELREINFSIMFRKHRLNLRLNRERLVLSGQQFSIPPIKVGFGDKLIELKPGETVEFDARTFRETSRDNIRGKKA